MQRNCLPPRLLTTLTGFSMVAALSVAGCVEGAPATVSGPDEGVAAPDSVIGDGGADPADAGPSPVDALADALEPDALEPIDVPSDTPDGDDGVRTPPDAGTDGSGLPDGREPLDATTPEGCAFDECVIDGECWPNGEPSPDTDCLVCSVLADPTGWSLDDSAECDDGEPCTEGDGCLDGDCLGVPVVCADDGNPCTASACAADTGECSTVPLDGSACDDGDPCTADDKCVGQVCAGAASGALACDDGNPCTLDTCLPGAGCLSQAQSDTPCSDGDPCTVGDTCAAGVCLPGSSLSCDDGDLCTADACDPANGGCVNESLASLCTDANPCTDEACDSALGCVFPANAEPCDDGSACTANDTCAAGSCVGAAVPIDDGNPCTTDSCDPAVGVVHVPNALPCEDGDACTLGDACAGGTCLAGATPLQCPDGGVCIDDYCDPAVGCVAEPNAAPCDDGTVCTTGDTCSAGVCVGAPVDCDDGDACTADSCDAVGGCVNELILSNACRPQIDVTYPPRGATIQGAGVPLVQVEGNVSSGAAPITSLTLNGVPVFVQPSGDFSTPLSADVGGNTLVFEATDANGTTRRRVQSFLWSVGYTKPLDTVPNSGMVDPGLAVFLSTSVVDDGDHSLPADDLATLFELVLGGFDVEALLPNPLASDFDAGVGTYDIELSNVTYGPPTVSLTPTTGKLLLTAVIPTLSGDATATKTCSFGFSNLLCVGPGVVTADVFIGSIVLSGDVTVDVTPQNTLAVEATNVKVLIDDLQVYVDGAFGWLANFIIGLFNGTIISSIEGAFEGTLADQLNPLLTDALSSLALSLSFDLPSFVPGAPTVSLGFDTDFSDALITASGLDVRLRTRVTTAKATPYSNLGVPNRAGCGSGFQSMVVPKGGALELVFADDTINQLLYAAWNGGLLEFPVPPELLGDFDLSEFGVDGLDLTVSGMLAPVISDCGPGGDLRMHVGDLGVTAEVDVFGSPIQVQLWASFEADVALTAEAGAIGLLIGDIETLETEINVLSEGFLGFEDVIDDLIGETLVPTLLGALGGDALSFPLPEIDLGGLLPGLPTGTVIALDPQTVQRSGGNTVLSGDLL